MPSDTAVIGAIGEKLVCIELIKRKIKFWEMKERNPVFDIIIESNNELKKIQVKSTLSKNNYSASFHQRDNFDYLIFVKIIDSGNEFFIVPYNEIINRISISFKNKDNYNKYKDNWKVFDSYCLDCNAIVGMQEIKMETKKVEPTIKEITEDALGRNSE